MSYIFQRVQDTNGYGEEFIVKKWLCAASLSVALVISTGVQAADKIAVVSIPSIFEKLPASDTMAKQLENEFKGRETELKSMDHDLKAKIKKLQATKVGSSEFKKLEKEALAERSEFSAKFESFERDRRRRHEEERNKIVDRIKDVVKLIAKKEGYSVVIHANAVAYNNSALDITTAVLEQVK